MASRGQRTAGEHVHQSAAGVVDGKPDFERGGEIEVESGARIDWLGNGPMEPQLEQLVVVLDPVDQLTVRVEQANDLTVAAQSEVRVADAVGDLRESDAVPASPFLPENITAERCPAANYPRPAGSQCSSGICC